MILPRGLKVNLLIGVWVVEYADGCADSMIDHLAKGSAQHGKAHGIGWLEGRV